MADAKEQIETWESVVKKDKDLQVIERVTGGLKSAKKLFKLIVKNPNKALVNQEFLYKNLPNIASLSTSYDNLIKSVKVEHETIVPSSQKLLRELSEKIAKNYEVAIAKEIEIIKNEVRNGE
jgi:5-bromo-4-chloroindolyl phosphate hydrolysis protein